ncbi:MAG: hypothetical protein NTZ74_02030 [Chloroflexi bacterium]|nr:hypothetical protein [Chloroflexota bacterium]
MAQHSKTKPNPLFRPAKTSSDLTEKLDRINEILANEEPGKALDLLIELEHKYPNNPEVIELFSMTLFELENYEKYLEYSLRLDNLIPATKWGKLTLARAYFENQFEALSLQTFRLIKKKWPQIEELTFVSHMIEELERLETIEAKCLGFELEEGLIFFSKHEEIQVLMLQEKFKRGKQIARELLSLRPDFSPVRNNLGQIFWLEGNYPDAIETSQAVLAQDPANIHALSALCGYMFMLGKKEKASSIAKKMKRADVIAVELWCKIVKTLSLLGDDDGVITMLEFMKIAGNEKNIDGLFWHWCAVAEYRRGNIPKARSYWKKCLKLAPYFSLASSNLEELKKPVHDRICPQVYDIGSWLPKVIIEELIIFVSRSFDHKKYPDLNQKVALFTEKHPEILQFIEEGMKWGDPFTREFAVSLVNIISDEETLKHVKRFSLGTVGPDSIRIKAAQNLGLKGFFPPGKQVPLWLKGEFRKILIIGFEIYFGSKENDHLKPATLSLMEKAIHALQKEDGVLAEGYLRQAIVIQPDEPSLFNNLAVSLKLQGRHAEVKELVTIIDEKFPDYFFHQISLAKKAIDNHDLDRAETILNQIMKKTRLHFTEFSALCSCQADFYWEDGNFDNTEQWLEMWESVYPGDPHLKEFKEEYWEDSKN